MEDPTLNMAMFRNPTILDLHNTQMARVSKALCEKTQESRTQCQLRGIRTGSIKDEKILGAMLNKSLTQAVVYEGFCNADLMEFAKTRGLDALVKVKWDRIKRLLTAPEAQASPKPQAKTTKMGLKHPTKSEPDTSYSDVEEDGLSKDQTPPGPIALSRKQHAFFKNPKNRTIRTVLHPNSPPTTAPQSFTASTHRRSARILALLKNKPKEPAPTILAPTETSQLSVYDNKRTPKTMPRARELLIGILEAADHDATFNFLGMPAELREIVYHYLCKASSTIINPQQQPAITLTCRTLRNEALPIYYRYNRFAVGVCHPSGAPSQPAFLSDNSWLTNTPAQSLAMVRSFAFVSAQHRGVFEIDFAFPRQEEITIRYRDYSMPMSTLSTGGGGWPPGRGTRDARRNAVRDFSRRMHEKLVNDSHRVAAGKPLAAAKARDDLQNSFMPTLKATDWRLPDESAMNQWVTLDTEWHLGHGFSADSIELMALVLHRAHRLWPNRLS